MPCWRWRWRLQRATGESNLVYGGGVALNCVANSRLERDGPFEAIHVYAAPHDAGTAIGAALETARRIAGPGSLAADMAGSSLTPFLGGEFDDEPIDAALAPLGACLAARARPGIAGRIVVGRRSYCCLVSGTHGVWAAGAGKPLAPGRSAAPGNARKAQQPHQASGVVQAVCRFGLGGRGGSLVRVSHGPQRGKRFARPHAPGLLRSVPSVRSLIPAVVHADGTCRIQTVSRQRQPRFHRLISAFSQMTGVPLVLNTSYNEQEPLVLTPDDALATFLKTPIDALFLNDRLVLRRE